MHGDLILFFKAVDKHHQGGGRDTHVVFRLEMCNLYSYVSGKWNGGQAPTEKARMSVMCVNPRCTELTVIATPLHNPQQQKHQHRNSKGIRNITKASATLTQTIIAAPLHTPQ